MHPKGVNSMAVSGLRDRKALVGTGRAISIMFGIHVHVHVVLETSHLAL